MKYNSLIAPRIVMENQISIMLLGKQSKIKAITAEIRKILQRDSFLPHKVCVRIISWHTHHTHRIFWVKFWFLEVAVLICAAFFVICRLIINLSKNIAIQQICKVDIIFQSVYNISSKSQRAIELSKICFCIGKHGICQYKPHL